jgi:hypothetical protein
VSDGALACPNCGADERTGWNEEMTRYDGMDMPDAEFDSDSIPKRSIHKRSTASTGVPYFTWIVAIALLALFLTLVIYRIF